VRWGCLAIALLAASCGKEERAPLAGSGFDVDAAPDVDQIAVDGALDVRINCSTDALCACEEIGQKPTSLYLVLDHSGSMGVATPGSQTKWRSIILALFDSTKGVIRGLGGRVALGVATFPGPSSGDECGAGAEVVPLTTGGKAFYDNISTSLIARTPVGGTPTAATLRALASKIKALPKPAFVLLATDGAPNCGTAPCAVDRCSYNIEKVDGCDASLNCCDPALVPEGQGWGACVDADATEAAVADLAAAGVKVFVLGIPGVGPYGADLDALATAGMTAREDALPGEPLYYAATGTTQEALATALAAVAAKVVDSCSITLASPPSDPGITNVVVDGVLVAQDPVDGWSWTADGKIELHGKTCDQVKKGLVSAVQVAVGCKTVTR
jgi:hypothetical protein